MSATSRMLHPALPLGSTATWAAGPEALAWRVRTVLETRPGQVPWRPDFGCDLEALAGQPATPAVLRDARLRIEAALRRWLPEVRIQQLQVGLRSQVGATGLQSHRPIPLAETALLRLGVQTELVVELQLEAPDGPLSLSTALPV